MSRLIHIVYNQSRLFRREIYFDSIQFCDQDPAAANGSRLHFYFPPMFSGQPKNRRIGMGIFQGNGGKREFHSIPFRQEKAVRNPDIIRPHSQKACDQRLIRAMSDARSSKGTMQKDFRLHHMVLK